MGSFEYDEHNLSSSERTDLRPTILDLVDGTEVLALIEDLCAHEGEDEMGGTRGSSNSRKEGWGKSGIRGVRTTP